MDALSGWEFVLLTLLSNSQMIDRMTMGGTPTNIWTDQTGHMRASSKKLGRCPPGYRLGSEQLAS